MWRNRTHFRERSAEQDIRWQVRIAPAGGGVSSGSMLISTLKHLSLSSDRDQSSTLNHKRWRLRAPPQRERCHGELPYQHVVVEDLGQCQASLAPPGRDGRRRLAGISPASNRSPRAWSRVTGPSLST